MVVYWNEKFRNGARFVKPFLTAALTIGFIAVALMYETNLIGKIAGHPLPGEKDPLRRVRAWQPTAALVEDAREKLEAEGKPAFIIADHYGMTGLFSFYLPPAHAAALTSTPLVYCIDSDEPENQFYFWPEYNYREHRKGDNAIFVSELDPYALESGWLWKWLTHQKINRDEPTTQPPLSLKRIVPEFGTVTDLGEHEINLGGRVFRRVHLWACYNLK
jgi:hypothetical protein